MAGINKQKNERILVTMPKEMKQALEELAQELSQKSIGKVFISDLVREGAKKILQEHGKSVD